MALFPSYHRCEANDTMRISSAVVFFSMIRKHRNDFIISRGSDVGEDRKLSSRADASCVVR